jgi:RNA recognition motif-containing protein
MTLIYVGNLADDADHARTRALFEPFGTVKSIRLAPGGVRHRFDGFGLIEMDDSAARDAIVALDGTVQDGAILTVREATTSDHLPGRPQPAPVKVAAEEDNSVRGVLRQSYEVAEIVKADIAGGDDWYRYVLASGDARITGFHRGSEDEVAEYAAECAAAFNERSKSGRSARTMAPPRRK